MRQAYVTMCNTTNYLKGVYILYKSLHELGSKKTLIVLIPNTNNDEIKMFLDIYKIDYIEMNLNLNLNINMNHYWINTFDKLSMFGLDEKGFDKLVFFR